MEISFMAWQYDEITWHGNVHGDFSSTESAMFASLTLRLPKNKCEKAASLLFHLVCHLYATQIVSTEEAEE